MSDWKNIVVACAGTALAVKAASMLKDSSWIQTSQKTAETRQSAGEQREASACPFGFSSAKEERRQQASDFKTKLEEKKKEITTLYEEYIHLETLREVWHHPTTTNPQLEPVFTAAMHGLEISFLLLAEFVIDRRSYVAKRQRIEAVARGVSEQCTLVADLVDSDLLMRELEIETPKSNPKPNSAQSKAASLSLAQEYPFPDCPPTVAGKEGGRQSRSLARLTEAVDDAFTLLRPCDQLALQNVIRNMTAAFEGAFSRWTVGLGIEEQLNLLRERVGLEALVGLQKHRGGLYLDYTSMVRPEVVLATRTQETYTHSEDFFFRSIHLATECWSFVALDRLANARTHSQRGRWHEAAAYVRYAGTIIEYLGANVSLLKCMNLRDYLQLKVEIEGTSGEGSSQVKQFKPAAQQLLRPLYDAVNLISGAHEASRSDKESTDEEEVMAARLVRVYKQPEVFEGLHDFTKALEFLDSSVCGGFYFRHFSLAVNVIGSDSRGTMNRSVQALKHAYEASLFPSLDRARTLCGTEIDSELIENKGRLMHAISLRRKGRTTPPRAAASGTRVETSAVAIHMEPEDNVKINTATLQPTMNTHEETSSSTSSAASTNETPSRTADQEGDRAFAFSASNPDSRPPRETPDPDPACTDCQLAASSRIERIRAELYDFAKLPSYFASLPYPPLSFLSHSFGQIPPAVHTTALKSVHNLYANPHSVWDVAFSSIIPEAQEHVRELLGEAHDGGAEEGRVEVRTGGTKHCVEFGQNTHELVWRLMSDALARDGAIHVLCSDTEFYSFNRQMKRLLDAFGSTPLTASSVPAVSVECVRINPVDTFEDRLVARAQELKGKVNVVYVSHVTYKTQETLIDDIPRFARAIESALSQHSMERSPCELVETTTAQEREAANGESERLPYIVVDGCHSFGAMELDLSAAPPSLFYVATMVKHAACGANAAFLAIHPRRAATLRPLSTGWLADPSTLGPLSKGVPLMDATIQYMEGSAMAGATPGYLPPLITFNETMRTWRAHNLSLGHVHGHVMALHERLAARFDANSRCDLLGLDVQLESKPSARRLSTAWTSHTLSWKATSAERAARIVNELRKRQVHIDSRGAYVRMGFGFNHSLPDVDHLAAALAHVAATDADNVSPLA